MFSNLGYRNENEKYSYKSLSPLFYTQYFDFIGIQTVDNMRFGFSFGNIHPRNHLDT